MMAKELLGRDVLVQSRTSFYHNRLGRVIKIDNKDVDKVLVHFGGANYLIKFSVDKLTLWSSFVSDNKDSVR